MSPASPPRAHVITGGFPRGSLGGHDMDYARLRILELLEEQEVLATVANDFHGVEEWLPLSQLLITYVAGPFLNDGQNQFVRDWIAQGGKWLGLHGTAGGRAARMEGSRRRRMVKASHHETLGGFFINHPPVRRFTVNVGDADDALTRDVPTSFETVDEPYMIEVQNLKESRILLSAELGPDASPEGFGFAYDEDTALLEDGKTRVMGYARKIGEGGVTYIALGHAHSPASNSQPFVDESVAADTKTPLTLRVTWETPAYQQLLRNGIAWGTGKQT